MLELAQAIPESWHLAITAALAAIGGVMMIGVGVIGFFLAGAIHRQEKQGDSLVTFGERVVALESNKVADRVVRLEGAVDEIRAGMGEIQTGTAEIRTELRHVRGLLEKEERRT